MPIREFESGAEYLYTLARVSIYNLIALRRCTLCARAHQPLCGGDSNLLSYKFGMKLDTHFLLFYVLLATFGLWVFKNLLEFIKSLCDRAESFI